MSVNRSISRTNSGRLHRSLSGPQGQAARLQDNQAKLMCEIPPDPELMKEFIERNPISRGNDSNPVMSLHEVNSDVIPTKNRGILHTEGGWPKEINYDEFDQTIRYRKKIEKDEAYQATFNSMMANVEHFIKQNNCFNIYEDYFLHDIDDSINSEAATAKTTGTFKYERENAKTALNIQWMPENSNKFVVAHCNTRYSPNNTPEFSRFPIWDINSERTPEYELNAISPVTCAAFNNRDTNLLAASLYSGQLAYWDLRKSVHALEVSPLETSHKDTAWKVIWLQSKSGSEFFSTGSDGQVLWWDLRKLTEPTESLILDPSRKNDLHHAEGSFALEYEVSIPTKFMAATHLGSIFLCNRKGKSPAEKIGHVYNGHVGSIFALQRNPTFTKYFLSIGDWSIRIWSEDHKDSYVVGSDYDECLLTDGAWSPTRPGVFFTTKCDGSFDVWDLMCKQSDPVLNVRVCNEPLECVSIEPNGEYMAVGTATGVVTLLQLSEGFWRNTKSEKSSIVNLFERETNREKIVEQRNKEMKTKKVEKTVTEKKQSPIGDEKKLVNDEEGEDQKELDPVEKAEKEFFAYIDLARERRKTDSNK